MVYQRIDWYGATFGRTYHYMRFTTACIDAG